MPSAVCFSNLKHIRSTPNELISGTVLRDGEWPGIHVRKLGRIRGWFAVCWNVPCQHCPTSGERSATKQKIHPEPLNQTPFASQSPPVFNLHNFAQVLSCLDRFIHTMSDTAGKTITCKVIPYSKLSKGNWNWWRGRLPSRGPQVNHCPLRTSKLLLQRLTRFESRFSGLGYVVSLIEPLWSISALSGTFADHLLRSAIPTLILYLERILKGLSPSFSDTKVEELLNQSEKV